MSSGAYRPGCAPTARMTPTDALRLPAKLAARSADERGLGVLFVLAAVACFSGLDTTSKAIGAMPVMMLVWFRYLTQASVTALTQWPRRGRALLETRHPRLHALRGLLIVSTSVCTNLALRALPVGELTAIIMLTPLLMTLVGATFLRERVSPARWGLIALAFAGALLVAKPGAGLPWPGLLLAVLALALNTGFHLVTGRLARTEDVGTMQFHTGCIGALLATVALPFFWTPVGSWSTWALLALVCVLSTAGHGALIVGYAKAGIATLTPLLYGQIATSTLLGWLVFAHVPDALALSGIAVITGAGAACTWLSARERDRARGAAALDEASMAT